MRRPLVMEVDAPEQDEGEAEDDQHAGESSDATSHGLDRTQRPCRLE